MPKSCSAVGVVMNFRASSGVGFRIALTSGHAIARPMRRDFVRYVETANKGARQLGFPELSESMPLQLHRKGKKARELALAPHLWLR